jgi:succinate dehydrogenase hydrophobic anchor subunit
MHRSNLQLRTRLSGIAIIFCSFFLVGCATSSAYREGSSNEERATVDKDRVAIINQQAKRNGVDVIWVNPPTRRKPD